MRCAPIERGGGERAQRTGACTDWRLALSPRCSAVSCGGCIVSLLLTRFHCRSRQAVCSSWLLWDWAQSHETAADRTAAAAEPSRDTGSQQPRQPAWRTSGRRRVGAAAAQRAAERIIPSPHPPIPRPALPLPTCGSLRSARDWLQKQKEKQRGSDWPALRSDPTGRTGLAGPYKGVQKG